MKLTNKIWLACLFIVIIADIIIIITCGTKSTLSYFVFSHKHWFIIPFAFGNITTHFFFTKRLKITTELGNKRYILLGVLVLIALGLTFIIAVNPLIPLCIGYFTGILLWTQVKIKKE